LRLIPILLIAVLFTVIYPLYNVFAQSSDNDLGDGTEQEKKDDVGDGTDQETKDEVKCNDGEELKDGKCVSKCNDGEELKDGKCVPIASTSTLQDLSGTTASVPSSTVLTLAPISEINSGDPIKIEGTLKSESYGTGIDGKTIKLAGTGIENLPAEKKTTVTEGGGKFTFTIPGNVPIEGGSLEFQASFKGDTEYLGTSKDGTYRAQGGIPTAIDLDPISNVNAGDRITVQGTLKTKSDDTGIEGKTVTLEGEKIKNLDFEKSFNTLAGGKFTFTIPGNVPIEGGSVNFQVLFEDDSPYLGTSKEVTYPPNGSALTPMIATATSEVATKLVLHEILNDNPDQPIKVEGTLTNDRGEGLAGKIITFSTSGTVKLNEGTVTTTSDGTFTV
jgi:hypothetical protein